MAVALVQKTAQQIFSGVSTTSRTITGVTSGNLVVCLITAASQPNPTNPPAIATPSGWTVAENPLGPGPSTDAYRPVNAIFYKANAASGSHTADFSGASTLPIDSYGAITLFEVSGCDTSSPLDTHNTTTSTSAAGSGSTPSVTNTVADAIAFAIGHPDSQSVSNLSFPPSSGYTDSDHSTNNSTDAAYDFGYKVLSATGSQSASWTWTGTSHFSGTIAIFKAAAGGGGVSGTAAWTEANDTAALTGTARVSGTSSWTEANDAAAVTGSVRVSGTAAWTEANDAAALTGSATVSGTAAWTEANDAAAIAGSATVGGSASWTEASDTAALTGTVGSAASGSLSWTEADDSAALTGSLTVSGSSAWTESSDTASLTGTVGTPVTGTASWTEASDTSALTGALTASASVGWTEANDTFAQTGSLTVSGSASWVEANDTWSISAFLGSVSGSLAWTEEDDIYVITGPSSGGGGYDAKTKVRKRVNELNKKILQAQAEEAQEITQIAVTKAKSVVKSAPTQGFDEDEEEALMLLL
jgi:hypothetical protein